jgi:hypothetical protein
LPRSTSALLADVSKNQSFTPDFPLHHKTSKPYNPFKFAALKPNNFHSYLKKIFFKNHAKISQGDSN